MRALFLIAVGLSASGCLATAGPQMRNFAGAETSMAARPEAAAEAGGEGTPVASITDRLVELCSPEIGFARGAAGDDDEGLCTGEVAEAYAAAFARGRALFAARVEVQQVKAEISAAQRELWAVRRKISLSAVGFASLSGRSDDRRFQKTEQTALAAEDARLAAAVIALQDALVRLEAEVRQHEAAGPGALLHQAAQAGAPPTAATPASY